MNGRDSSCDDPFHNNFSSAILESPCKHHNYYNQKNFGANLFSNDLSTVTGMGGRKGRDGLFPATSCIKIAGYFGKFVFVWLSWNRITSFSTDDNKETITVRGCALDSGTLTTDTGFFLKKKLRQLK